MASRRAALVLATSVAIVAASASDARANGESAALRARASEHIYNLDRDLGIAVYRQAIAADPADAGAYRGLASGLQGVLAHLDPL